MRSALLRGREHHALGMVDVVAEGNAAVAISVGGARKRYSHTDPNEDAAAYAVGEHGTLIAAADAHDGFEASEVVLDHFLTNPAPNWTSDAAAPDTEHWRRHALAAIADANGDILRERADHGSQPSTTTLSLALLRVDIGRIFYASLGDSHLFVVDGAGCREIDPIDGLSAFLGHAEEDVDSLARIVRLGSLPLDGVRAVLAVTDGISERGIGVEDPCDAVAAAAAAAAEADPAMRAAALARAVAEAALAAQRGNSAGDNIAVAATWLT